MQNKIVLDPNYRGPIILEEYLRKMKSQSSFGRMISTYNKRFFALDFKRMIFYYLPEKGSQLSNAKDIPLESITRIYLDTQLQLLDDGQIWKHGFVILCGKRSYKLISHSQNNMENLLYAFSHLINNETKKPLFDWNEYKSKAQKQYHQDAPLDGEKPQIFSPAGPGVERKDSSETKTMSQANPVVKKKDSQERRSDDETDKPNAFVRDTQTDKGRQEIPEGPRVEDTLEVRREKSKSNNENPKQAAEVKKKLSGERREEEQPAAPSNPVQKRLNIREVDNVDVCESQMIMENESVHANISMPEEEQPVSNHANVEEKRKEPLKNRVEVLNIDPTESGTPTHSGTNSTRNKVNLNRRLMNQDSPKDSGWGQSPKSDFAGQLKAKTYKSSEERYEGKRDVADAKPEKQQISQDQDDGWGQVKKENIPKVEKKVQEVDEWDSPPKKKNVASKVQDDDDWDKDMNYSPPQKKSVPNNVGGKVQTNATKKADDDDDWDKEMFDDHSSKPQNSRFEIRTEAKYTSQTSGFNGYSSSTAGFGKPSRTIEVVVAKGNVHNDWDDDL